jgi:YHS domain-containing protein
MMKRLFITFVLCGLLAMAGSALAKEIQQATCPVMGGKPVETVYTDYQGKRIYFCCPGCIDIFNKDPEKYMEKLKKDGAVLEDAPKS